MSDSVIKVGYILAAHADAAIGSRGTKAALLRGAVDIDRAPEGVSVPGFGASEPQDAGHDGVPAGSIGLENLSSGASVFKNAANWCVATDFFSDLKAAKRSAVAAWPITDTKFGS